MSICFWCGDEVGFFHVAIIIGDVEKKFHSSLLKDCANKYNEWHKSQQCSGMYPERHLERRMIGMRLLLLLLLLLVPGSSFAQKVNVFKLNQPRMEESLYCFVKQAAMDVVDAGKGREVVWTTHFQSGDCVIMKAIVIYSRKVYQNGDIRVYEGIVGGITVYNPTDFIAEGETDL